LNKEELATEGTKFTEEMMAVCLIVSVSIFMSASMILFYHTECPAGYLKMLVYLFM
jgi:nucleoside recognition membrane protein YjiH